MTKSAATDERSDTDALLLQTQLTRGTNDATGDNLEFEMILDSIVPRAKEVTSSDLEVLARAVGEPEDKVAAWSKFGFGARR